MPFTFLANAKKMAAAGAGECAPDLLSEVVNDIRQELYSWYEKLPLFRHSEECFQVQDFAVDCNRCQDTYRGLTLPRDCASVEAMWFDSRRVELFDRWRQWQYGMSSPCDCGLQSFDMGEFPTERDLLIGQPKRITFYAMDTRDEGKRIEIRGRDVFNREFRQPYRLTSTPMETESEIVSLERVGGVTKDITLGRVVVQESGGRILSILAPEETVPSYKRLKITGLPDSCQYVNIRAARLFVRLFDDYDVVETDNSQVWAAMARAQRLASKAVKDGNEIRSIAADKLLAENLLRGDNTRQMGKHNRVEIRVPMPAMGGRRLRRNF